MNRSHTQRLSVVFAMMLLIGSAPQLWSADKAEPDKAAVERARKNVRMLDDVYKTAVVLITDKYVNSKKDHPAGRAAIAWFKQISDKGSHEVRLIDVSGKPYSEKNVAKDDFDKEGVKQLQEGKDYFEKIVMVDGKPRLRAMTSVPVVMEKCVMCHANYKDAKKGAAVGALTYSMPIE